MNHLVPNHQAANDRAPNHQAAEIRPGRNHQAADGSAANDRPPPPPAAAGAPLPGPPPLRPPPFVSLVLPRSAPWRVAGACHQPVTAPIGQGERENTRLTVPDGHRVVRALWAAMRMQGLRVEEMADKSGVAISTLQNWHSGFTQPSIVALERALRVVGLQLTVEPRR